MRRIRVKRPGSRVEAIETTADGADPDEAVAVTSGMARTTVVAEAGRVGGVVLVAGKAVGGAVKEIEAIVGADPEAAGPVLVEGRKCGSW